MSPENLGVFWLLKEVTFQRILVIAIGYSFVVISLVSPKMIHINTSNLMCIWKLY